MKSIRKGINRNLSMGCILLCCLCLANTVLGQGNGDYDADWDVDGADFAEWAVCMTGIDGTGVTPWSPCGAFDFDGEYDVDLLDFGFFQAAYQKPPAPACTPPAGGRNKFYIGLEKNIASIGVEAKISRPHHRMKLCDENLARAMGSSVWISVSSPNRWLQIGYQRYKRSGLLQDGIFAESMADQTEYISAEPDKKKDYYNMCLRNPDPGLPVGLQVPCQPWVDCSLPNEDTDRPRLYSCEKEGWTENKVIYKLDGQTMHTWNNLFSSFRDWQGSQIQIMGELFYKQDDLVGKENPGPPPIDPEAFKCTIEDMKVRASNNPAFTPLPLSTNNLRFPDYGGVDYTGEWGLWLKPDGTVMKLWDKNLNPQ